MQRHIELCERIRKHCQKRSWYGPDDVEAKILSLRGYLDSYGRRRSLEIIHDFRSGFEFSPTTEEQLFLTEQVLQFSLPPMLRTLYTHVANGGFGPGYGITGIRDGYTFGNDGRYETMDKCRDTQRGTKYIDLANYSYPTLIEMPQKVWPAHFLHFCYWGCGTDSYIEGKTGQVYCGMVSLNTQNMITMQFYRQEQSLEDWIEHWLQGSMQHWFEWDQHTEAEKMVIDTR